MTWRKFLCTEMMTMIVFTVVNMSNTAKKMIFMLIATGRPGVAEENQKVGVLKTMEIPFIFHFWLYYDCAWSSIKLALILWMWMCRRANSAGGAQAEWAVSPILWRTAETLWRRETCRLLCHRDQQATEVSPMIPFLSGALVVEICLL